MRGLFKRKNTAVSKRYQLPSYTRLKFTNDKLKYTHTQVTEQATNRNHQNDQPYACDKFEIWPLSIDDVAIITFVKLSALF